MKKFPNPDWPSCGAPVTVSEVGDFACKRPAFHMPGDPVHIYYTRDGRQLYRWPDGASIISSTSRVLDAFPDAAPNVIPLFPRHP